MLSPFTPSNASAPLALLVKELDVILADSQPQKFHQQLDSISLQGGKESEENVMRVRGHPPHPDAGTGTVVVHSVVAHLPTEGPASSCEKDQIHKQLEDQKGQLNVRDIGDMSFPLKPCTPRAEPLDDVRELPDSMVDAGEKGHTMAEDWRPVRGVSYSARKQMWAAQYEDVDDQEDVVWLGQYMTAIEAARAYDNYVINRVGLAACRGRLNFPAEEYGTVIDGCLAEGSGGEDNTSCGTNEMEVQRGALQDASVEADLSPGGARDHGMNGQNQAGELVGLDRWLLGYREPEKFEEERGTEDVCVEASPGSGSGGAESHPASASKKRPRPRDCNEDELEQPGRNDPRRSRGSDEPCIVFERISENRNRYFMSDGRCLNGISYNNAQGFFLAQYYGERRKDGLGRKTVYLGRHATAEGAARAHDRYLIRTFGLDGCQDKLNFPASDYEEDLQGLLAEHKGSGQVDESAEGRDEESSQGGGRSLRSRRRKPIVTGSGGGRSQSSSMERVPLGSTDSGRASQQQGGALTGKGSGRGQRSPQEIIREVRVKKACRSNMTYYVAGDHVRKYYREDGVTLRGVSKRGNKFGARYYGHKDEMGRTQAVSLGEHATLDAAARAYDCYVIKTLGLKKSVGQLNFPLTDYDVVLEHETASMAHKGAETKENRGPRGNRNLQVISHECSIPAPAKVTASEELHTCAPVSRWSSGDSVVEEVLQVDKNGFQRRMYVTPEGNRVRGISKMSAAGKYLVRFKEEDAKSYTYIGQRSDPVEAARAYDQYVIARFGADNCEGLLNFALTDYELSTEV